MATKLYVANLPPDYTEQDLLTLFSSCGKVIELDIIKNYAFVHMGSSEAAQNAMAKYNNSSLHGRIIQVQLSRIQNVNRSNKYTVKYDRPVLMGKVGQGNQIQRGGNRGRGMLTQDMFGGGTSNDRYGLDLRGRGGFRGSRGGPDTFHRGKPYDRNPGAAHNHPQNQSMSSNLKPIQPIGGNFTSQNNSSNLKLVQPNQQNIVLPQSNQHAKLHVPVQLRPAGGPLQSMPTHATSSVMHPQIQNIQAHQIIHGQQQILQHQNITYQPISPYRELQSQGQAVAVAPQHVAGAGVIHQQSLNLAQPCPPMSSVSPLVQPSGMTPGINHQQSSNPLQGYTVYERYVDYRNPQTGDIQQIAVQSQLPVGNGIQTAVGPVYQSENAIGAKDLYSNSQMMYERQSLATSRAAMYAFPTFGGNPATTMMSGTNMMQVVSPAAVIPSVQLSYQ